MDINNQDNFSQLINLSLLTTFYTQLKNQFVLIDNYNDFYNSVNQKIQENTKNIDDIKINLNNNYYTKDDIDSEFDLLNQGIMTNYYSKTDIDSKIIVINNNINNLSQNLNNNYYNKTYIDNNFLSLSGGTLQGNLTAPTFIGNLNGNANTSSLANKVSNKLIFTGAVNSTYDGSKEITVNIPTQLEGDYLPLSGGTLTGNLIANGGIEYSGNSYYIAYPGGGTFHTTASKYTGYLKIKLPVSWNNTMIKFTVNIYNYFTDTSATYFIAGYNYSGNSSWINVSAYSIGNSDISNLNVRFGHDGSKCIVLIGESTTSWSYPQISISNIILGFDGGNYNNFKTGWNINIDNTAVSNIDLTITNPIFGYKRYLSLSGGTLTGSLTAPIFNGDLNGNATSANKVNNQLSFIGYQTKSYDGSQAVEIEIPDKTSQLTNDSNFATTDYVDNKEFSALTDANNELILQAPLTPPQNLLINGDFKIWQRGEAITVQGNGGKSYTADMWEIRNQRNSAAQMVHQKTDEGKGTGFRFPGLGSMRIYQWFPIEEMRKYDGQYMTRVWSVNKQVHSETFLLNLSASDGTIEGDKWRAFYYLSNSNDVLNYAALYPGKIAYSHVEEDDAIALLRCKRFFIKGTFPAIVSYRNSNGHLSYICRIYFDNMREIPTCGSLQVAGYTESSSIIINNSFYSAVQVYNGVVICFPVFSQNIQAEANLWADIELSCEPL